MYILVITALALLQSFTVAERECLPKICNKAYDTCTTIGHPNEDCRDWADEVFHCCNHCESCNASSSADIRHPERACRPQVCDAALKVCKRVHKDSDGCQDRANKAGHCCDSCDDCSEGMQPPVVVEHPERKCRPKVCDAVLKICEKVHNDTDGCQDRANKAGHCCDSCDDCSDDAQPPKPKDQCHHHLCKAIYKVCNHANATADEDCWEQADDATNCCDECESCESATERVGLCEPLACEKSFDVCRSWLHDRMECYALVDSQFNCCGRCHDCH